MYVLFTVCSSDFWKSFEWEGEKEWESERERKNERVYFLFLKIQICMFAKTPEFVSIQTYFKDWGTEERKEEKREEEREEEREEKNWVPVVSHSLSLESIEFSEERIALLSSLFPAD